VLVIVDDDPAHDVVLEAGAADVFETDEEDGSIELRAMSADEAREEEDRPQ
jgi:hypothetical protein